MNSSPEYQRLLGKLTATWVQLPDKPEETPEFTLNALWLCAQGTPVSVRRAAVTPLTSLTDQQLEALEVLVDRRQEGIPLAHLTGRQNFMELEMLAGPEALIPRVETEILAQTAIDAGKKLRSERGALRVLDICCGSGNVALAIASAIPDAIVFGSDLSHDAAGLAGRNARHLGLDHRVVFRQGDMFSAFASEEYLHSFDLLTCNPPYISSAKVTTMAAEISHHEPRLAFDGGMLGVTILKRLVNEAPQFLKPGSVLCCEVGLGQGNAMARMFGNAKEYVDVATRADARGDIRAIRATAV